ncbi:hypothetical protein ACO2Q3_10825 [Caulobacter sp. KR2-114]|uniref:hypothetical protein n=1 Tax=Caulobacter sp. KR2-114 TaxID=3400912 RepID=UPI003BFEF0B6
MASSFWEQHWWLVFAAAALVIPVGGMIASTFTTWLHFRQRREALAALKAYADSGRTPPPELAEILKAQATGPFYNVGVRFGPTPGAAPGAAPGPGDWSDPASPWADPMMWGSDRYARRAARQAMRMARWRYRAPYRRWSAVVWLAALTVGFGYAAQHATGDTANAFLVTAIILGAATVGSVVTAVIATVMRP